MHRATLEILIPGALIVATACAPTHATAPTSTTSSSADSICSAPPAPSPPRLQPLSLDEPPWGATIKRLGITGAADVPRGLLTSQVRSKAGTRLSAEVLAGDVRRLSALEALDDVRVETDARPDGVEVAFAVTERQLIDRVELRGAPADPVGLYLPPATGELFDRARLSESARNLERHWQGEGHLDARVTLHERPRGRRIDVCIEGDRGPRFVIDQLRFVGNDALSDADLLEVVDSQEGRVNCRGAPFRSDLFERDLLKMTARYYDAGYVNVHLGQPRVVREPHAKLSVEVPVDEGAQYRLGRIRFRGRALGSQQSLRQIFGQTAHTVFNRSEIAEAIERVRAHLEKRGRKVTVTPTTELDEVKHEVKLVIEIEDVK